MLLIKDNKKKADKMTPSTLGYSEEKQGGFLSRLFNKITAPVREFIGEFKEGLEEIKDAGKFWERNDEIARLDAIEYLYKWAYEDVNNTNDINEMHERLTYHLTKSRDHMDKQGIGVIKIEELTTYAAHLTDEKKAELKQSRFDYQKIPSFEL